MVAASLLPHDHCVGHGITQQDIIALIAAIAVDIGPRATKGTA